MPRADRHAQPGTAALWLLGWRLVAIMRIVLFIFFMLKTICCSCSKQNLFKDSKDSKDSEYFFQNISRIPLSAVDIKIVHMVYRFLHKKYLLPYL